MDPADAIWDALNDERHEERRNARGNDANNEREAPRPPEQGDEDPNELLAAIARLHLADIEALREAGAGEDALLALDLFGDELRHALEMVEDREVAARVQRDDREDRPGREHRAEDGEQERRDPQPPRAEAPEATLASLIRRIPGAWALPLPLGGIVHDQHDDTGPAGPDAAQEAHPAGAGEEHDADHIWGPGWLLGAARQWMLGNGTPPEDRDEDPEVPPECVVCTDVIPLGELIRAPCGHPYDVHCMTSVFTNATRDEALFPPRCCRTRIPVELVRGRVPDTTLANFSARAAEFATPKRLYCAAPTCSAFLGARYTGWFFARAILCAGCGGRTCSRCAQAVKPDERHRCRTAEDENELAEVAAREAGRAARTARRSSSW
ncbi:hypothetical protein BD626DRAFT_151083 [Schizophyllum amplum]|uniref:RING-type domain-containing protein n=1 Tax=Schizophyllum amplum TaxID=97359 RepID=A0A550C477_9AGAR|nr:hypothetical protein BD626DRAFT_151083 [Auriculariopsis ampla]